MFDINSIVLSGNLVDSPELKIIAGDKQLCVFRLASSRRGNKEKNPTVFIDCELWGAGAPNLAQFGTKGLSITIQGALVQENWKDKTGSNRTKFKIFVNDFKLGPKMGSGDSGASAQIENAEPVAASLNEEDIPF